MKRAVAILGLIWLTGAAEAEDRDGGPLEGTKQELKSLQADQAAAKNGVATGKITDGLPQLQSPVPGAVPPDIANPEKPDKEQTKRNSAQKNWLLDGVDRLEKESRGKTHDRKVAGASSGVADEQGADRSDPDYLLKLYSEQPRGTATRTEALHAESHRDPMAPFLQNWLTGSPVRGKFFDDFVKKGATGDTLDGTGAGHSGFAAVSQGLGGDFAGEIRGAAVGAKPTSNPYLQAPEIPAAQTSGSLPRGQLTDGTGVPAAWPTPALAAPADPMPAGKPPDGKTPLLAPLDNQKYFPQQKKF